MLKRTAFLRTMLATVSATQLGHVTAALALDEAEVGHEYFSQLRDNGDILFDSSYYEHLNEIGSAVAQTVRPRYEYPIRFYIIRGDSANAFSVPGGNIYVNEPLLKLAKNRDEVAGVLSHESGHMVLHHVAKRMANANRIGTLASIGSMLGSILGGPIGGMAANYGLGIGTAGQDANLSRHIEAQADEEGARIVAATDTYNPYGMIWFFQTMTATYGPGQSSYMRTHPLDQQRIDDLQRELISKPDVFAKFSDTKQREVAYW